MATVSLHFNMYIVGFFKFFNPLRCSVLYIDVTLLFSLVKLGVFILVSGDTALWKSIIMIIINRVPRTCKLRSLLLIG